MTLQWVGGFLAGAAWSTVNFLLILALIRTAVLAKDKRRVWLLVFVKFPVLYFIGFLILKSGWFPILSLLVGCFLALIIVGVVNYVRSSRRTTGTA